MPTHQANTRRNTELALFIAAAVPVFLLYAMYLMNMSVELNLTTLGVPPTSRPASSRPAPTRRSCPSSSCSPASASRS